MSFARPDERGASGPESTPLPQPWSLAARLTAWYLGSSLVLLFGSTGFLYWALVSNLDREDDQFLADRVAALADLARDDPNPEQALRAVVEHERSARQMSEILVRIVRPDGTVVAEAPGMPPGLEPDRFPLPTATAGGAEIEPPNGRTYRAVSVVLEVGRRSPGGPLVAQLAFDRTYEEQLLARYRANLLGVLAITVLLCALAGHRIARGGMKLVDEIAQTAERVHSSTLDERIGLSGLPLELARLAATINAMLNRLEASFGRLRQFSADIAHELRTPVNNLRGAVEVALGKPRTADEYRDVLASALEETGRLAHLIDSLLFLARTENPGSPVRRDEVDLSSELERLREFYEPAAVEAGVTLTCAGDPLPPCALDRALIHRAVGNVIENSLKNTRAGGRITLSVRRDGAEAVVTVSDTGQGIAAAHLPHVFERLYRADPSRTADSGGLGLGLAIVKRIATLHQGTVTIASTEGEGTEVTLRLPQAPAPVTPPA